MINTAHRQPPLTSADVFAGLTIDGATSAQARTAGIAMMPTQIHILTSCPFRASCVLRADVPLSHVYARSRGRGVVTILRSTSRPASNKTTPCLGSCALFHAAQL